MSKKTEKIVQLSKEKSELAKQKVLDAIEYLLENEQKISFYRIMKETGVSKSFLYNNEEVREVIERYRDKPVKTKQTDDTKDVLIAALKSKISELEKELSMQQKDELWRDKCEVLSKENKELKKQIEKLYGQLY